MPQSSGTSQNESMQFGNNRAGYANSVYTL
jgi:hypothetical protein